MLVLQRKKGQSILIEDVEIRVLKIKGSHVSIGVKADNCLRVIRAELLEEEDAERSDGSDEPATGRDCQDLVEGSKDV